MVSGQEPARGLCRICPVHLEWSLLFLKVFKRFKEYLTDIIRGPENSKYLLSVPSGGKVLQSLYHEGFNTLIMILSTL